MQKPLQKPTQEPSDLDALFAELSDEASGDEASVAVEPVVVRAPNPTRQFLPPSDPIRINYEEQGFSGRLRPKVIMSRLALTARKSRG